MSHRIFGYPDDEFEMRDLYQLQREEDEREERKKAERRNPPPKRPSRPTSLGSMLIWGFVLWLLYQALS